MPPTGKRRRYGRLDSAQIHQRFQVKPRPEAGVCRVVADGEPCPQSAFQRGLCRPHWAFFQARGLLDEYGAPKMKIVKRYDYAVNPNEREGICRIMADGVPCRNRAESRGLCHLHRGLIANRSDLKLADFQLPPKALRDHERILTRFKIGPDRGRDTCRLIVDGKPCGKPVRSRGLCQSHWEHLKLRGFLERFATPLEQRPHLAVKPNPTAKTCRLLVNGLPCMEDAKQRGLCISHYKYIWKRPDLDIDDFALPTPKPAYQSMSRKKKIRNGICIIVEDGVGCGQHVQFRGLCRRHYAIARLSPQGIDHWALPKEPAVQYKVKVHPDGCCRIIESADGHEHACREKPVIRGLCSHHYQVLSKKEGFEAYALPKKPQRRHSIERKPEGEIVKGICVIVDDGIPCAHPAKPREGLICRKHRACLQRRRDLRAKDLEYYPADSYTARTSPPGVCRIVAFGMPCDRPERKCGVCGAHYEALKARGLLSKLCTPGRRGTRQRRSPGLHVYLDKNIIIDYLVERTLGKVSNISSSQLVEAVLAGKLAATVSANCITAANSYLRLRLVRPPEEGGLGAGEDEARQEAERAVGSLFFGEASPWRFVPYEMTVVRGGRLFPHLSWEDGMEWAAFEHARDWPMGPDRFVTRDGHFKEGVSPNHVLTLLAQASARSRHRPEPAREGETPK